ncbi:MAG: PQQ-binding-like beta-propeller repeat protein [Candidatus Zixiibacteriota bacterium]
MQKYIVAFLVSLIFISAAATMAQLNQDSPWPMFRHDVKHTGMSPYTGPGQPVLKWTYLTNDGVASSPSIGADGTIYVGSGWLWRLQTDSALYAINPDGTLKWKYLAEGGVFSSPAIDQDGTIYFGSFDHNVYAIEDSVTYGKKKWNFLTGLWVMGSPIISDDGSVYIGALNSKFYALNSDGNLKWEDQVGWCVFSSAAFDDFGHIIVGSKDHNLYAYNDLETDFSYAWTYSIGTFYDGHLIDASPAIGPDGTVYFACDQYGAGGAGQDPVHIDTSLFALHPDGSFKWLYVVGDGVESSPAVGPNGMIYFGSYDSCFYALYDAGSHPELKWKYKTNGVVDASPTIGADGTIYIGSRDSTMYAFNPDGTILWTFKADGDIESSVTINGDGVIYFGGMDGNVYALGQTSPDVGPKSINIIEYIVPNTSRFPMVTVRNYRTMSSTFDVALNITLDDNNIYSDTVTVADLPGGDSADVVFAEWNIGPEVEIYYDINVSTILTGDENTNNDTLYLSTFTGQPVCGDANGNDVVNILDITYLIGYLYKAGPAPVQLKSADVNSSGNINILDITYLISYLYKSGSAPNCMIIEK